MPQFPRALSFHALITSIAILLRRTVSRPPTPPILGGTRRASAAPPKLGGGGRNLSPPKVGGSGGRVLLGSVVLCNVAPAFAHTPPRIEARGAAVVVNKQTAVRFSAANGSQSPVRRAHLVAERLQAQAERGLPPAAIQVRREGRQWRVVLSGRAVLLFVTRADGRANHSAPKALAFRWAAQLRSALALPPLTLRPARIVVPYGETRLLTLGGYADGAFTSRAAQGASCVTLMSRSETRRLIVRGEKPGTAVVRVQVGEDEASCVVVVKKYAGRLPTGLSAEVTGNPGAPPDLVAGVAAAVLRRAPCEPGAFLKIVSPLRLRHDLSPGASRTVTARVVLEGQDYLPVSGTAQVRVYNRALPPRQAAHLFYSNAPEHILHPQTLYAAPLTAAAPIRLMFHHDNQTHGPVVLAVTLTNPEDRAMRVHLVPGFVPPGGDPATVGYRSGQVFLRSAMKTRGEIWTLPAHAVMPLLLQRLDRHQTASGIAEVALVDAPDNAQCLLRVDAEAPNATGFPRSAQRHLDVWRYAGPRPASDSELAAIDRQDKTAPVCQAARTLNAHYTVGERWAFVPLGMHSSDEAAHAPEEDRNNAGDYGVLYTIHVTIENPHPTTEKVEVDFGAGGGPAMAVFNIGGRYLDISETRPPDQRPLARFTLRPHETRIVTIRTVPLGGSTYPANVIVR